MIEAKQIKPEMPVVCSADGILGLVDHMEGKDTIKLKKDDKGQHHFVPLAWVKSVDGKVHLDRPGEQVMKEWSKPAANSKSSTSGAPGAAPDMKQPANRA